MPNTDTPLYTELISAREIALHNIQNLLDTAGTIITEGDPSTIGKSLEDLSEDLLHWDTVIHYINGAIEHFRSNLM